MYNRTYINVRRNLAYAYGLRQASHPATSTFAYISSSSLFPSSVPATKGSDRTSMKFMNSTPRFSVRAMSSVPVWANVDPDAMGKDGEPHVVHNLVNGKWQHTKSGQNIFVPDPMDASNSNPIFLVADTKADELGPFIESMKRVSKSGVHNPLKNVSRYLMYGEISRLVRIYIMVLSLHLI